MTIVVHLTAGSSPPDDLAGARLEPVHPGATDPNLVDQFYTHVPDADADEICSRLLAHPNVAAAYPKPAGSPPADFSPPR